MFVDLPIVTRYTRGFRSSLELRSIAARALNLTGIEWALVQQQGESLQLSGTARAGSVQLAVWSETWNRTWRSARIEPGERLYCFSIAAASRDGAEMYFERRAEMLEALEGRLVVTSVVQEIEATHAAGLEMLALDGQELTELPDEIRMLDKVTCLSVSDNQLRVLPDGITEMRSLTELDVSQNLLAELPAEIGRLSSLEILSAGSNRLRELPASIGRLGSLQELRANDNKLRKLPPELGQMGKLRRLYLQQNRLTELPQEFVRLTNLYEWDARQKRLPPANPWGITAGQNLWVHPPEEVVRKVPSAIRDFLTTHPRPEKGLAVYTVFVEDNRHRYEEEWKRRRLGDFPDCAAAIAACRKIVDDFFANYPMGGPKNGLRGEDVEGMVELYRRFGEDPWVLCDDPGCGFDSWRYAEECCQEIARVARANRRQAVYTVYADEKYATDESGDYTRGEFADAQQAIVACQQIVDGLLAGRTAGTAEEMLAAYKDLGESPVVLSVDKLCVFSGWWYAAQRCREIAAGLAPR